MNEGFPLRKSLRPLARARLAAEPGSLRREAGALTPRVSSALASAGEGSGAATASLRTSRCRGRKCNRPESWRGLDPAAAGSAEVRSRDVLLRDAAW